MMPDPQWVRPIEADRFLSQPCKYLELCDEGQGKSCHGDLTAALAVDWLLKRDNPTRDSLDQASPLTIAKHRLLLFERRICANGFTVLPFSHADAQHLIDEGGFPDRFFATHIVRRRLAAGFNGPKGRSWLVRDWLFSAVTLETGAGHFASIVIVDDSLRYSRITKIIDRLKACWNLSSYPLLLFLALADGALEDYRERSDDILIHSEDIHHSLGLPFNFSGPRKEKHLPKDPAGGLADLANKHEHLIRLHGDIRAFHASLQSLSSFHEACKAQSSRHRAARITQGGELDGFEPEFMLAYLVAAAKDILERVRATDTRLQLLFPVLQIRMTQKDTEIGLRLSQTSTETAIAAKEDSSSMKVIAVLTTVFLPGTFTAALVSTPEYSSSLWHGQWRYWAIAVPLTAVVMLVLSAYMYILSRRRRRTRGKVKAQQDAESAVSALDSGQTSST